MLEPVGAADLPLNPASPPYAAARPVARGHTYSRRLIQASVTQPQIGGR